jgi:hypothetical protein
VKFSIIFFSKRTAFFSNFFRAALFWSFHKRPFSLKTLQKSRMTAFIFLKKLLQDHFTIYFNDLPIERPLRKISLTGHWASEWPYGNLFLTFL